MATIKDVAQLAGVSFATVSIILNGKEKDRKISVETQDKVIEAMKALNYRPNVSAKKLRSPSNKEYIIGVYWASDFRANFLTRIISGIQSEIPKYKYPINIVICPYKNNFLRLEKGLRSGNTFHAAIIANTSQADMEYLTNHFPKIPTVLYNRFSEAYNTVTIDNFEAGKKAAMALINHAMTDIGAVLLKDSYLAMGLRSQGFFDTCRKNNIIISNENIIAANENSIRGGVLAAEKILNLKHRPKAIFCDSDSLAQGLLHVFYNHHIKIPDDIAIIAIGMGSIDTSEYSIPPLTIIDVPMERMAAECVNLIVNVLEHKIDTPTHIHYDSELIIRDSFK